MSGGPDPRFYETGPPVSLADVARLTGAALARGVSGQRTLSHVASLATAGPDSLTYCADRALLGDLAGSAAGACFLAGEFAAHAPHACAAIVHPDVSAAFATAARHLHRRRRHGLAPAIDPSAVVHGGVELGPGVVIGAGATLAEGCLIGPNAVIGPGVVIGRGGEIGAGARISCALIGDRARILAGAVIGEAGFGAAAGPNGLVDLPQLGRVILGDGVTIGAGACVDRGTFGDTVVGDNTKIDNLVQIGHNVVIGHDCVLAAHVGISGSVTIGDGCMFGGRAGIADHLTIGDGARIAAAAGLMHDVPAGESWGGVPARPVRQWFREVATLARLASRGSNKLAGEA